MSALAAAGQVREALTVYQDAKDRLVEETGLDPDPGLTDLYTSILRGGACAPARPVPRQLPAFRDRPPVHPREHDRAWGVLTASGATTCPVVSVNGPGGIGKSAFAVHLAHHVEDRYPDGQLFADLHGNVPGHDPVDADRVVRRFLRALGHGGDQWQDTEDATAQFRSVTAGLRVLIVLDDVRDVAQVRPLLPGGSRCAVIVTSRHTLPSLRGAEHVALSLLDRPAARALFRSDVEAQLAPADERVLDAVLDRCDGLPLALSIVAARYGSAGPGSLPGILETLADESLHLLGFDDGENSLTATLAGSLEALSAVRLGSEAVELFILMALHPGPSVPVQIAAALADRPVPLVRQLGELLHRYRLIEMHRDDRLAMHDLVRVFAVAEAEKLDREVAAAATRRMRSAYIAAAAQAYRLFRRSYHGPTGRNRLDFLPHLPDAPVEFGSSLEADEWFVGLLPALDQLVRATDETDRQFPGLLFLLLKPSVGFRAGLRSELAVIGSFAAALCETADAAWAAYVHNDLAEMQSGAGDHAAAIHSIDRAEASAPRHGRTAEAVGVRVTRVRVLLRLGDVDRALILADEVISESGQLGLSDIGARAGAFRSYALDLLGEHAAAVEQSARLVAYADGDSARIRPANRAEFLINHAFRLVHGGRAAEGLVAAEKAQAIATEQGLNRSSCYAEILWGLAEAHRALGDVATADVLRRDAATILLAHGRIDQAQHKEVLAGHGLPVDPAG
jgi:tetratricopeptide (TPR) repeat protein